MEAGLLSVRLRAPLLTGAGVKRGNIQMLYWAFLCLVIAIIAAIFGFGIAASAAAAIGKILFLLFLVGFVVSIAVHMGRRA
jgi:uncharacterized membrane protein YtjA (UPF0391 family)